MNTNANKLLSLIDNRIRKILKETSFVTKRPAVVVNIINDDWCQVRLSGDETAFTMANVSGSMLNVGDSVYIETVCDKLNTGVVTQRFNTLTSSEEIEEAQYHTIQKAVMPINSVVNMKVEPLVDTTELLSKYYGGVWQQLDTTTIAGETIARCIRIR